jgi:hypothetical protein
VRDPQVSVEVAGVRFGRFGASGWYRWNGSWAPVPEPLWTEPMLDKVAHLQSLIDAWADAWRAITDGPVGSRWGALCLTLHAAEDALLAAATPKEDDR